MGQVVATYGAWEVAAAAASIVAAVSTAMAAYAALRAARAAEATAADSRAAAKRDEERHERALARELQAQVVGSYVYDKDTYWLQIENLGPSPAYDVGLIADPAPNALPVERMPDELRPGVPIALHYRPIPGTAKPRTEVSWTDGSGHRRSLAVHPDPIPLAAGRTAMERVSELRRMATDLNT